MLKRVRKSFWIHLFIPPKLNGVYFELESILLSSFVETDSVVNPADKPNNQQNTDTAENMATLVEVIRDTAWPAVWWPDSAGGACAGAAAGPLSAAWGAAAGLRTSDAGTGPPCSEVCGWRAG